MDSYTQAQAEDRRAQVEALMDRTLSVFKEDDNELEEAIEALLDELDRLSRVEQALREALSAFPHERMLAEMEGDGLRKCGAMSVPIADLRRWRAALTASPEAQPEEGNDG